MGVRELINLQILLVEPHSHFHHLFAFVSFDLSSDTLFRPNVSG